MSEVKVTKENFTPEVLKCDIPVLLDFWAEWCGPCRMQAPILEQLDSELGGSVKIGKVDVDEEPELARRFGVMSIPTLIAFRDGKAIAQNVGVTDANGLKRLLGK